MRYAFGTCRLDTASRDLIRDGAVVHLSPKAYTLLRLLIDARPRVVTKAELMQQLWPDTYVVDANLPVLVGEVRTAIGDRSSSASAIRTHHGVGYSFVSDVLESPSDGRPPGRPGPGCSLRIGSRRIGLADGINTVGREPTNDVCLDDGSVSRHHAQIVVDGTAARVEDLGSKNGTCVGDTAVTTAVRLTHGDHLQFGGVRAQFLVDPADEPSTLTLEPRRLDPL